MCATEIIDPCSFHVALPLKNLPEGKEIQTALSCRLSYSGCDVNCSLVLNVSPPHVGVGGIWGCYAQNGY